MRSWSPWALAKCTAARPLCNVSLKKSRLTEQQLSGTQLHKNCIHKNHNPPPTSLCSPLGQRVTENKKCFLTEEFRKGARVATTALATYLSKEMISIYRKDAHRIDGHRPSLHKTGWFLVESPVPSDFCSIDSLWCFLFD